MGLPLAVMTGASGSRTARAFTTALTSGVGFSPMVDMSASLTNALTVFSVRKVVPRSARSLSASSSCIRGGSLATFLSAVTAARVSSVISQAEPEGAFDGDAEEPETLVGEDLDPGAFLEGAVEAGELRDLLLADLLTLVAEALAHLGP